MVTVHSGGLGVFGGGESAAEHAVLGVCLAWKAFRSYPGRLGGQAGGLCTGPAGSPSAMLLAFRGARKATAAFGTKSQGISIGCIDG